MYYFWISSFFLGNKTCGKSYDDFVNEENEKNKRIQHSNSAHKLFKAITFSSEQ